MRRLCLLLLAFVCIACTAAPVAPAPLTPTAGPLAATSAPLPTTAAVANAGGLALYQAAMKPEFAAEVDRFATAPQYQIDLTIAPDRASYSAKQKVRYTNAESVPLNEVYFRLFPNSEAYGGQLKIESLKANGADVTPHYELAETAMKIELAQPLKSGEAIEFEMEYSAQVPTQDVEIGYNRFGLHSNILALPGFFPLIPVYDDEGWNVEVAPPQGDTVFSDTALFQVNITAPAEEVVATSGVCEVTPGGQIKTWRCVSGPMRDFMIAMSPDYQVQSETVEGIKLNSYYREDLADEGKRGLQIMANAVRAYDKHIGQYPFNELDLVATPTTAGGIEYPGLVVIAEGLSNLSPDFYEGATAHETAHQWWYSLVGNDQIDEPWLDEALTEFTTALYYREQGGSAALRSYVIQDLQQRYDRVKGTPDDKRADLPVDAYSERQYGAIVYGKAALFFNAIYKEVGDEKFDQLLQEYYTTYRYGVAYPQDFLAIAAKYTRQDKLEEILKEWIETP
ncbi:MAG TPA: M1 family aminopeptidase [Anaerolineae bacterium]|nr:M1 family aminopeptidase [Anaerolineae bacterium]